MGGIAKKLFGGGDKAAKQAQEEAEKSRQLQQIANDRQLAQLNDEDSRTAATRKAPRGRRLFESDPAGGGLASTLGG